MLAQRGSHIPKPLQTVPCFHCSRLTLGLLSETLVALTLGAGTMGVTLCPVPGSHRVTHTLHLGHPRVPRSCANSFHGRLEHRHTGTVAISAAVLPHCVSFTHITSSGSPPAHHLCINSRLARSWPNFWAPLLQGVNGGFAAAKRDGLYAQEAFT